MFTGVFLVPAAVVVAVLLFLMLRTRVPLLRMVASPVEQSALRRAEIAEAELSRANVSIEALEAKASALEKERSMAAVVELVEKVSQGVDETLAKLADLNGSLKASAKAHGQAAVALDQTNENLKTSTKAIELLASQIIIDVRGRE